MFQEDDRDRLAIHASGVVLQRVSEDELASTSIDGSDTYLYPAFAEHAADQTDYLRQMYKDLNEDAVRYTTYPIEEDSITIHLENYPYSLGELSEEQLLEEKQVIQGERSHPETDVSEEEAVEQLLTGSFESTPSYDYVKHWDLGYHFHNDEITTGVTVGHGARTNWSSGPAYSDIADVAFSDHVYTVHYTESTVSPDKVDRFYRISEDILYAEDENGEFTVRYEQGTDWKDFQGLPDRE
ncbi:hypothetical protein [Atopococcus tabaci]|uniref:hypothetical protein n=1 Tax=Atopococcus tabaci TaxID=269774 RepID=UPI00040605CA|nr:hypothetical protein [Atopococcus tabaci]